MNNRNRNKLALNFRIASQYALLVLTIGLIQACSSRGMELAEQIPELHPEYAKTTDQNSPYFLAVGGDKDRIIDEQQYKLEQMEEQRSYAQTNYESTRSPASEMVLSDTKIESTLTPNKGAFLVSAPRHTPR